MIKTGISQILKHRLFKKIFGLTVLLYLSPIVGVLVDIMFIRRFGAGEVMDLYRVLMAFIILGNGLLSAQLFKFVVIPKLSAYKAEGLDSEGLVFAQRFILVIVGLISPILMLGLFAPAVMLDFLAPGLGETVASQGIFLTQIAAFGLAMTTIVGAVAAVLNFYGNFWGQPLGQILLNAAMLGGLLLFGHWATTMPQQIAVVEYSMMAGIAMMTMVSLYLYSGIRQKTGLQSDENFLTSLGVIIPLLLPQLILLASEMYKPILINQTLSYAEAGAVALYLTAYRMLMLGSLPVQGVLTVLFPDMANRNIVDDAKTQLRHFVKVTSRIFAASACFAVIFWILADLIIAVFAWVSNLEGEKTAWLLELYRILLIFAPFGAIGNFFIQKAYASNLRLLVIVYSVANVAALALLLPTTIGQGAQAVATIFVAVQGSAFVILGMALFVVLYRRSKNL